MGAFRIEPKKDGACGGIEEIEHGKGVPNVSGLGKFRGFFESRETSVMFFLVDGKVESHSNVGVDCS